MNRVPVNGLPFGTISWQDHAKAYIEYHRENGNTQTAERVAERGGFGMGELMRYLLIFPRSWQPDYRTPKSMIQAREES